MPAERRFKTVVWPRAHAIFVRRTRNPQVWEPRRALNGPSSPSSRGATRRAAAAAAAAEEPRRNGGGGDWGGGGGGSGGSPPRTPQQLRTGGGVGNGNAGYAGYAEQLFSPEPAGELAEGAPQTPGYEGEGGGPPYLRMGSAVRGGHAVPGTVRADGWAQTTYPRTTHYTEVSFSARFPAALL